MLIFGVVFVGIFMAILIVLLLLFFFITRGLVSCFHLSFIWGIEVFVGIFRFFLFLYFSRFCFLGFFFFSLFRYFFLSFVSIIWVWGVLVAVFAASTYHFFFWF